MCGHRILSRAQDGLRSCRWASLLLFAAPAFGQQFQVQTYEETDGLPSARIADIAQDSTGRLWVAARQRLASYDGVEWESHGGGQGSLRENPARILVDDLGQIWALPWRVVQSVSVLSDGTWRQLPPVFESEAGTSLWTAAVTVRRGDEVHLIAAIPGRGVLLWDGEEWHGVPATSGMDTASITDMEARGDDLYIATQDGLFRLDPSLTHLRPVEAVEPGLVRGIEVDPRTDVLWIIGADWAGKITDGGFERVASNLDLQVLPPNRFVGPVVDWSGGVYFGHTNRLWRLDTDGSTMILGGRNGLLNEGATALFVDREGNVWVGSGRGLSKLVSMRFANYAAEHGLHESEVTSILKRRSGEIVLGHPRGITVLSNPVQAFALDLPTRFRSRLLEIEEDGDGGLWLAAQGKGLGHWDGVGQVEWSDLDPTMPDGTNSVLCDGAGNLWVSESRTIFRRDAVGGAFKQVAVARPPNPPKVIYFRRLVGGGGGRVYAASSTCGIHIFEGAGPGRWLRSGESSFDDVFTVLETKDGERWVGTRGGLCRLEGDRIVWATDAGMNRPVYSLLEDAGGALWCGTDDGVWRWDGSSWRRFSVEEGLIARETNRDALLLDDRDRVWIGTERGVSVYEERFDLQGRPPPTLALIGVEVDGKGYDPEHPVRTRAGYSSVEFRFRATGFVDEERMQFRYRLHPLDETWTEPLLVPDRRVRYASLPPGSYRFEVQARGPEQPWSAVVTSSTLRVPSHLWLRPWFLGLVVLTVFLVATGLIRTIARLRYTRDLEGEVQRRLAENLALEAENEHARRLESLGVLAGGIAHDFNNLLTVMTGSFSMLEDDEGRDAELRALCSNGLAATERARALTQQLLTFSKGGAPLLRAASITEILRESTRFAMTGSDLVCDLELPDDLWPVLMDPDQISQVLSNLLLNARQASSSGQRILIRAANRSPLTAAGMSNRYVEVRIQDHGAGIPADLVERVFDPYFSTKTKGTGLGLATAYSIVKRHGGSLEVESVEGQGTTFVVRIPAADEEPCERESELARRPGASARQRVLVMDDDEGVRNVLMRMLQRLGHDVEVAVDGDAALLAYTRGLEDGRRFDTVLMDLTVPGGAGGKATIARLLERDSEANAIVISGYSNDPVMADYAQYGFRARLSKPVSINELRTVLGEAWAPVSGSGSGAQPETLT